MSTDIHQHLWTEPLVEALARRRELPFVREEKGLTVLFGAGERPYVIDLDYEAPTRRAELVAHDGLDRALVCLSSPLGIESLERAQATSLIDAYLDGALELGHPFGVWGAVPLDGLSPGDVDRALDRGCVGISLPAGALGGIDMLARMAPVLARAQDRGAPVFVHPGPAKRLPVLEAPLADPLWWSALTRYVAEMQAAWLVWVTAASRLFPELRVIFSMLAGLAPLHAERLHARGGPNTSESDPLVFYDTSSYGPAAVGVMERFVGARQLVYGSDRPVVDPHEDGARGALDWSRHASNAERALLDRSHVDLPEVRPSGARGNERCVSRDRVPVPSDAVQSAPSGGSGRVPVRDTERASSARVARVAVLERAVR